MGGPPTVEIRGGTPTDAERSAVEQAILAVWRQELAKAARTDRRDPWLLAARAEAVRAGSSIVAGEPDAWRLAARLSTPHPSPIQPGRGDAR